MAFATLLFPAEVRADCQSASSTAEALATAEVAFVGTVVAVRDGVPGAFIRVEEVWMGDIPQTVEVRGIEGASFREDDRIWAEGARYLILPYLDGGVLRDHMCTGTIQWRADLAALAPSDAHLPLGGDTVSPDADALAALPIVVAVVAVALLAGGWALTLRRSARRGA